MNVLGIDPGTACGWALLDSRGNRIASGTWDLKPRRHEGGGMRYLRVRRLVEDVIGTPNGVLAVGYEEVRRHAGTDAAHVYGGIVAMIAAVCEERKTPYMAIPVGTVKRAATGKGNADKIAMVRAANARWGLALVVKTATKKGVVVEETDDDDEADALWIAECTRVECAGAGDVTDAVGI